MSRLAHLEFDSRGESEFPDYDVLLTSQDNVTIGLRRLVCSVPHPDIIETQVEASNHTQKVHN